MTTPETGITDEFLEMIEHLFDMADAQTAYVLERIFANLAEEATAAEGREASLADLKHKLLLCKDIAAEITVIEDGHPLEAYRLATRRCLN